MAEKWMVESFCFEDKETYELAQKEAQLIRTMRQKCNLSDGKNACKIYLRAVEEKVFSTAVGYSFLAELHSTILKSGKVSEKKLPAIPVKPGAGGDLGAVSQPHLQPSIKGDSAARYKRLYEGQCLLNRRLKIVLFAAVVLVIAFVIIDWKSEYSVFTYFTDYKAKMEEELINKYEEWENNLQERENALNNSAAPAASGEGQSADSQTE